MTLRPWMCRPSHSVSASCLMLLAALATACGGGGDAITPSCTVSAVSVSPASATLVVGATSSLTATPTAQNCSSVPSATWSSSAPGVASVSSAGVITAITPGTATVTATVAGASGSSTITVTLPPVASAAVTTPSAILTVGSPLQATAVLKDASNAVLTGRAITWSSSNVGIATVNSSGLISGVASGSVTITATAEGQSGSVVLTSQLAVASVTVAPSSVTLLPLATSTPSAVVKASDNSVLTGRGVAWSTSNAAVATVNAVSGLITAVAPGTATITATSEGVAGTMAAIVVPTAEANRFAFVWSDDPARALNVPSAAGPDNSVNAAGGASTVTRTGVGTYTVVFGKLAKGGASVNRENFFVTSYGSAGEYCRIGDWGDVNASDIRVGIVCFDVGGTPANAMFTVAMIGSSTLSGQYGFLWNSSATANASGTSAYSFSTGSGTIGSTRLGTGNYATTLGFTTAAKTAALVSTYTENAACSIDSWAIATGTVNTKCTALGTSTSLDARSNVLLMEAGRPGKRFGFAWADLPNGPYLNPYTPSAQYQNQSNGQSVSIVQTGVGAYNVSFANLSPVRFTYAVLVSAYANGDAATGSCQVFSFVGVGSDVMARVKCWDHNTRLPANQRFVIVLLE